jgi:RecB family exonuclease
MAVSQNLLWTTKLPSEWPQVGNLMSVSTLAAIESCPRRWALSNAHYPDLWEKLGYPPRSNARAVEGTVVHSAVERIIKEFTSAGYPKSDDPAAVQILKRLGGYTAIVHECIEDALRTVTDSPRTKHLQSLIASSLRAQVPELRARVQALLSRPRLASYDSPRRKQNKLHRRSALPPGIFAEIELRALQIGWKGRVDLLVVSPEGCEITDFKTGTPDDSHRFQMQAYALLWFLDYDLNPDARPAKELTLAYIDHNIAVPPLTISEIEKFRAELLTRTIAARSATAKQPPLARPTRENCEYCTVKHLCAEYWTIATQQNIRKNEAKETFVDIEVEMTGQHGEKSWDAVIRSDPIESGRPALVRYDHIPVAFRSGQRVRLLSVYMTPSNDDQIEKSPAIITMGAFSEAFTVVQ